MVADRRIDLKQCEAVFINSNVLHSVPCPPGDDMWQYYSSNPADELRIKQMIQYIEEHYGDKVLLEDIASAAGVSGRECSRCFSRTVKMSPIDYLNRYCVRMAAGRIVETGDPIGLIAEECGFTSDSYFGKMFKSIMGCSPRDYWKNR